MIEALILAGMCCLFVVIAWLADRLAAKHRWINRK